MSSGISEGTLSKWTNVMKGWQYRFFVLEETAGLLSYYTVSSPLKTSLSVAFLNRELHEFILKTFTERIPCEG